MKNTREVVIGDLSNAIQNEGKIRVSSYKPEPQLSKSDRVIDAIIADVIRRFKAGEPQPFSGVRNHDLEKLP